MYVGSNQSGLFVDLWLEAKTVDLMKELQEKSPKPGGIYSPGIINVIPL